MKEMQKPLARYIDDEDLDQMLREQEREGDPMADFMRKKKAKERPGTKGQHSQPQSGNREEGEFGGEKTIKRSSE